MPVGRLTPEVAHNGSKNPIHSSSHHRQPDTFSSGLYDGSLLDTLEKMSPEVLRSTGETADSEKLLSKKSVVSLVVGL